MKAHSAAEAKSHENPTRTASHEAHNRNPEQVREQRYFGDPRDCHSRGGMYAIIAAESLWNAGTKHNKTFRDNSMQQSNRLIAQSRQDR